jgi:hypothetical protein
MAGSIHPGIAHIALQQNATATRMPPSRICVQCGKKQADAAGRIKNTIYIIYLPRTKLPRHIGMS